MIQIRFIGHEELLNAYGALEARIIDLSWLWEVAQLRAYIGDLQAAHFASEGAGQWPQLAASTVRERERKGYGNQPMLVRDATLRARMVQPWAAGGLWDAQPGSLTFGPDLFYAGWLHEGTDKMPARSLWAQPLAEGSAEGIVDVAALELGVYSEALGFGVQVSR